MKNHFSKQLKEIISLGHTEALRLENDFIGTGHLLLGLIKEDHNYFIAILNSVQAKVPELKKEIEACLETGTRHELNSRSKSWVFKLFNKPNRGLSLNPLAEKAIRESIEQAKEANSPTVEAEHLMLSILKNTEDKETKMLNRYGLDYHVVAGQLRQRRAN